MQCWTEAYACTLQCIGEAAVGQSWTAPSHSFLPAISALVEAFIGMIGPKVKSSQVLDCWANLPQRIPKQGCKGPCAAVIDCLNELTVWRPLCKAWDEFSWPEPPVSPTGDIKLTYIQGCIVDMGVCMLPMWFHVNDEAGEFLGYAWGLLFEGTILVYDPSTNKTEWVLVHGSMESHGCGTKLSGRPK